METTSSIAPDDNQLHPQPAQVFRSANISKVVITQKINVTNLNINIIFIQSLSYLNMSKIVLLPLRFNNIPNKFNLSSSLLKLNISFVFSNYYSWGGWCPNKLSSQKYLYWFITSHMTRRVPAKCAITDLVKNYFIWILSK